jgi:transposase-like protein
VEKTPLSWANLGAYFVDEDKAREYMEFLRWGNNVPACPHCGGDNAYRLTPKATSAKPGRKGLLKCRACRKQFTVTVGTVFEQSHIKLTHWIQAIYLIGASKKGISAHQLHRMLGITYRSAWFMMHRLRYAMDNGLMAPLSGTIEVDEAYIGGKRKGGKGRKPADGGRKAAVAVLVERGGNVRAMPMERVDGASMTAAIREHVAPGSVLMTDETSIYPGPNVPSGKRTIAGMTRYMTNHSAGEYVRGEVHTNTAEGFISLLKRGIVGTFHHVGKGHLGRYVSEFEFRYNARKVSDAQRPLLLVAGAEGKRLTYKQPGRASAN